MPRPRDRSAVNAHVGQRLGLQPPCHHVAEQRRGRAGYVAETINCTAPGSLARVPQLQQVRLSSRFSAANAALVVRGLCPGSCTPVLQL